MKYKYLLFTRKDEKHEANKYDSYFDIASCFLHIGVRTGEPVTGDRGDRTGGVTEYDSRYRDRGTDVHGREYGTGMDAGAG